jgi:hypothetical protein
VSRGVIGRHCVVVFTYSCLAVLFSWPLALHFSDSLLGPPGSDLGVYIWNLWVFRHELVAHHAFPFYTAEILSLTERLPLTLQNYTVFSDLLAFELLPVVGLVATFNLLMLANGVLSAYAMFLYALRRTNDMAAALVAGILFGFSPFMTARSVEHLSLMQAAPLPIFGLLMLRMAQHPTRCLSALAGLVVAWAFLCDPYYAVYCLFILGFIVGYSMVTVDFRPEPLRRDWWTTLVDLALVSVAGLIAGILLSGGGSVQVLDLRIGLSTLYTPVLIVTVLLALRTWLALKPHLSWIWPAWRPAATLVVPGALVMALALTPLVYPMFASNSAGFPGPGAIPWRNGSPGLDVLAYVLPNPFHPWLGALSAPWFGTQPNGFTENVASIPWVAVLTMVAATAFHRRWAHIGWIVFTAVFIVLSLGPFLVVDGITTHIPGPWALIRYLPLLGAARMPTRIAILVLLGMSMLLAMAIHTMRNHVRWPRTMTVAIALLLIAELLPAPRALHSAEIPQIYQTIANDPRPVRVMNLPFGLRDGLSSAGNQSAEYQYHQTLHEKPLVGGYVSRLPAGEVNRYRQFPVMSVLMDLSEERYVTRDRLQEAMADARESSSRLQIGWVVVDARSTSAPLEQFATDAFDLTFVERDGPWKLYKTSLTLP